ncbi:MAG TPA: hypothetical protein VGB42_01785 [Candidatus Thermoplasmatota archaeon]
MSAEPWVPVGPRPEAGRWPTSGEPRPPAWPGESGPPVARPAADSPPGARSTAARVALADFRRVCGQTAVGAALALVPLTVAGLGLQSGPVPDSAALYLLGLMVAALLILPLAVSAAIAMRHYAVALTHRAAGRTLPLALLTPVAFLGIPLMLLSAPHPFVAFLISQAAPSAGLLVLAATFARPGGPWPAVMLMPGAGGLAVALAVGAWVLSHPGGYALMVVLLADEVGPGVAFFFPYLLGAAMQVALGVGGRALPLRLREDRRG